MDAKQRRKILAKCVLASVVTTIITVGLIGIHAGIGGGSKLQPTYSVIVCFEDLHGVPAGAPVRLCGVKIGEVACVGVERHREYPTKLAYADLAIDKIIALYHGDRFEVGFGALIGDRYIRTRRAEVHGEALNRDVPPTVIAGAEVEPPNLLDQAVLQEALSKWAQSAVRM